MSSAVKKVWRFIWEEDSVWSWLVNVVLAFILIKFIVYPGLGWLLATSHPVVAVVSGSMEHQGGLDVFWEQQGAWYEQRGITKEMFGKFRLKHGFNKGDIMVLYGTPTEELAIGDVIVFQGGRDPIIHRIVEINNRVFHTKGDNNGGSIQNVYLDETQIQEEQVIGRAVVRIPWLGYIKIWFVNLLQLGG